MVKTLSVASLAGAALILMGMQASPRRVPGASGIAELTLSRLDCGSIVVSDLDVFSDTFQYRGQSKTLTNSCYLIKHGGDYMLWDTGLPAATRAAPAVSGPFSMGMKSTVVEQLARVSVRPADIDFVGISHSHGDHIGQASAFPGATLLMGQADFDAVKAAPDGAARLGPWISGGAKYEAVARDKDVFGDGRVVILDMPGHTPGHKALLVDLASGPVLLTGDLYHFTEQVANNGVPSFNADRSDTLGSMDRFKAIARNRRAKVIIQHEPADVAKLPAFPTAAR